VRLGRWRQDERYSADPGVAARHVIGGLLDLTSHLAQFTAPEADALVFTSPTGTALRPSNFRRCAWAKAVEAAGVPVIHFHDLRHTGNTLTAEAGASLRELMERMGHSSTRAAMIYLHSTSERQRALADTLMLL
jgi:integrase